MLSFVCTRSEVVKALDFDVNEVDSAEVAKELIISNAGLIQRYMCSADQPYNLMCQDKNRKDYITLLTPVIGLKLSKLLTRAKGYGINTPMEDVHESLKELKRIQSSLYSLFNN